MRRSEIASFVLLALSLACGGGDDETEVSIPAPAGSDEAPVEQQVAVRDLRIGTAVEEGRASPRRRRRSSRAIRCSFRRKSTEASSN